MDLNRSCVTVVILVLAVIILPSVCNESVNKDAKVTKPTVDPITANPHADLPTRFGDEDDVIKLKQTQSVLQPDKMDPTAGKTDGAKKNNFDHFNFDSDEEEQDYDDDEEDFIMSEHFANKDESDDSEYKNTDYEEGDELGPTLDNFGTKLDGGGDTGDELPVFLSEPQSTYVIRSRPAVLKCRAAHALQVISILFIYCCTLYVQSVFLNTF